MENGFFEVEFRVVEPDGTEHKMYQKIPSHCAESEYINLAFMYNRFIEFLRGFGFYEKSIERIQYIREDNDNE